MSKGVDIDTIEKGTVMSINGCVSKKTVIIEKGVVSAIALEIIDDNITITICVPIGSVQSIESANEIDKCNAGMQGLRIGCMINKGDYIIIDSCIVAEIDKENNTVNVIYSAL